MLDESPYIGKAQHKRKTFTSGCVDAVDGHLATEGVMYTDKVEESRHNLERGTDI